jgi:hypothetical protein
MLSLMQSGDTTMTNTTKAKRLYEELRKHMSDDDAFYAAIKLEKIWAEVVAETKAKGAI